MLDGVQFPWLISLLDKGQRVQPGGAFESIEMSGKRPLTIPSLML